MRPNSSRRQSIMHEKLALVLLVFLNNTQDRFIYFKFLSRSNLFALTMLAGTGKRIHRVHRTIMFRPGLEAQQLA